MTTDKTQRERDLEAGREHYGTSADRMMVPAPVAFAAGAEHGRRDSDAWRAAMREAVSRVRRANVNEYGAVSDYAIENACEELESLAGTAPPRTYEDGLREAARMARGELGAMQFAIRLESLAASTPAATPSADGAGDEPWRTVVKALLRGIRYWASQEDGIPEELDPAYRAGIALLGFEPGNLHAAATPPEQPRSAAPPEHNWDDADVPSEKQCQARGVFITVPDADRPCPGGERAAPPGDALRAAVDEALSNIECAELKCWSFTRDAMRERPRCDCANCETWRRLSDVFDAPDSEAPPRTAAEERADVVAKAEAIIRRNKKWSDCTIDVEELRDIVIAGKHVGAASRAKGGDRG